MQFYSFYGTCMIILWCFVNSLPESTLPKCNPHNLKMTDINEKGKWVLLKDGTFKLTFPHCSIHEYTVAEAKKCFRNEFVLFMGDSLSRYFYLSLASFFASGGWSVNKLTHNTIPENEVSIMAEADYKSWSEFYRISNAYLNNRKTNSYEICDCFRDDSVTWNGFEPCPPTGLCSQQESCLENRMFRTYLKHHGQGIDHEDGIDMVRLGYIQFYGSMPMRGRNSLLMNLPLKESEYLDYTSRMGELMCPLSVMDVKRVGELDKDQNRIPDNPEKHSPLNKVFNSIVLRNGINISNALVPMRGVCGKELVWHRDDEDSPSKLSMPQFHSDHTGEFDSTILKPLNITHLIVNIGFHSEFNTNEEFPDPTHWLRARVEQAKKLYRVNEHSVHSGHPSHISHKTKHSLSQSRMLAAKANNSSNTKHSHHGTLLHHHPALFLPQVTYRGCTPYAVFTNNDENAKKLYDEYVAQTEQSQYESSVHATDSKSGSHKIENLIKLDHDRGANKLKTKQTVDAMGLMPVWDIMVNLWDIHKHFVDNNITKLNAKEYNKLKYDINAPSNDKLLNSLIKLKFDLSIEILSSIAKKESDVEIPVYPIYVDAAHPQPWVYDQLNNAFLNSVCMV